MKDKKTYIIAIAGIIFISIVILGLMNKPQNPQKSGNKPNYLDYQELEEIKDFLEDKQNNSFLYCEYQNPSEIDLTEVLSEGAEISQELTVDQKREFNKKVYEALGEYPQVPLIVAVTEEDVAKLFEEKTGEKITDVKQRLEEWLYLDNGSLYTHSFEGNRYTRVDCRIGEKEGDKYIIYAKLKDSTIANRVKVTLKKQEDKYLFVSNEFDDDY